MMIGKSEKSTPAESGAERELCGDVIVEILLKLPVKSLLRFKSVSKTWLQTITSGRFISNHHSTAKIRPTGDNTYPSIFLLRVAEKDDARDKIDCFVTQISIKAGRSRSPEFTVDRNIRLSLIEGRRTRYSDPLMFAAGFGLYCILGRYTRKIALWNPGTRKVKLVPPSHIPEIAHLEVMDWFCFGHVEYKDDGFSYKVGLLSNMYGAEHIWCDELMPYFRLQLYSSSSDSWKLLMTPEESRYCGGMAAGINLNGKYHILCAGSKQNDEEGSEYGYHIMTFDYSSEVFGRIEVSDLPRMKGFRYIMIRSFVTLDEDKFLCLVIRRENEEINDEQFLDVWVMHEYGVKESWSKKGTTGPISIKTGVLGYSERAGGFLLEDDDRGLYLCNCAVLPVNRLTYHVDFDKMRKKQMLELTTESLVPIKGASDWI